MFCALLGQYIRLAFTGLLVLWFDYLLKRMSPYIYIHYAIADKELVPIIVADDLEK